MHRQMEKAQHGTVCVYPHVELKLTSGRQDAYRAYVCMLGVEPLQKKRLLVLASLDVA